MMLSVSHLRVLDSIVARTSKVTSRVLLCMHCINHGTATLLRHTGKMCDCNLKNNNHG